MIRRNFLEILAVFLIAARSSLAAAIPIDYSAIEKLLKGRKLFLVPFSHTDWAWSNSRSWMVDRHAKVLEEALDLLKSTPGFRFYIETWNEQMETFLARRPDRISEMQQALNTGQIAVCGATTNQHPGWMEAESLVRDLIIGRRLFHEFASEVNLDVMVKPDVTPGSSQMPQILKKAGYRYFGIDRPDDGLTQNGFPRHFVWKGLDGSEIIVARDGGCGFIASDSLMNNFTDKWPSAVEQLYKGEIAKHIDKNTRLPIWLPVGCDDARPLRHWQAEESNEKFEESLMPFSKFIEEWNKRESSTLQFATPQDVFREIDKQRSDLPVHQGIMEPTMWTYWYGLNGNEGLRLWRTKTDHALVSGELFWSCVASTSGDKFPEKDFANMWRDLLRAYSHAQMWLFTTDYEAALNIVKRTLANAVSLKNEALSKLVSRMRIDEKRQSVVLFNELPWERTEVVNVWAQMQHPEATNIKVSDGQGQKIPFQVVDVLWYNSAPGSKTKHIRELNLLIKATIPSLGYTTIYFEPAPGTIQIPESRNGSGTIDTDTATLTISDRGVESVLHKKSGKIFKEVGNIIFNEIEEDGPYNYGTVTKTFPISNGKVEKFQEGALCCSFSISGSLGQHRVMYEGLYYPHNSRLSFQTTIHNEGGNGHFMTITDLPGSGRLNSDIHFGVEERDVTKIVYKGVERRRKDVFWGSHWTNWSDGLSGITLVATTGEKGFQYFPEQNRLGHFLLMSITPVTETVRRFVTKAREGIGKHIFDYQFLFHEGGVQEANVVRQGLEARHPIVTVNPNWMRPQSERNLAVDSSFLKISPANVQLSAFYKEGGKQIVRVYESSGNEGRATIDLPFIVGQAHEVDFNSAPIQRMIEKNGKTIVFDIRPWEIVTVEVS
jgi:alpha-mannosidase